MGTEAGNETTALSVRVPETMKARFDKLAHSTGRTRNYLLNEALEQYLVREAWQIAELEEAIEEADAHPEEATEHGTVVRDMLAGGMVTQGAIDRAEAALSLDELRRAQQAPAR